MKQRDDDRAVRAPGEQAEDRVADDVAAFAEDRVHDLAARCRKAVRASRACSRPRTRRSRRRG